MPRDTRPTYTRPMTRIDFYILADSGDSARNHYVCRLVDKAYRLGRRIYIHTESQVQTRQLDDLLWTFRQGSFLPHEVHPGADPADPPPILLGHEGEPDGECDVLVNLATDVPLFFSRFQRVAEIVDGDPQRRRASRAHFKFFRDRGYPIETHEIDRR